MTREMSERLNFAGFPGFLPSNGRPISVRAQFNAMECESSTILSKDLTDDITKSLNSRFNRYGSSLGERSESPVYSDSDSEGEGRLQFFPDEEQPSLADPSETAARIRNHVGTVLNHLHPEDRDLLCGIADSLDQGELAATDFVSGLFRKNNL